MAAEVLDAERLKTDVLLELNELTAYQKFMYEYAMSQAKLFRRSFEEIKNPTPQDLSIAFREVMAFGFSQQALAVRFGVATGTFSRWVSTDNPPREYARKGIAEELTAIVDYIIERLEAYLERHPSLRPPKRSPAAATKNLRVVRRFGR